jgi:hypothetical protein
MCLPEGDDEYIAFTTDGFVEVAAGSYDVEVTTNPPTRQTVTVVADEIVTVQLGGIGTIQLVDAQGNPTNDYNFYVFPEGDDDYIFFGTDGLAEVAAGAYDVEVWRAIDRQTVTVWRTSVACAAGRHRHIAISRCRRTHRRNRLYVYPEEDSTPPLWAMARRLVAATMKWNLPASWHALSSDRDGR